MSAANVRHGTRSRYARGCRCDACRAASAAYMRSYRRSRAATEGLPTAPMMRQALTDIRALHAPYVEQGTRVPVCMHCCTDRDGFTAECLDHHDHLIGQPICPTAEILDRAGL